MYQERRNFGINAVIFVLFTANIGLRNLQVSAARLATTDSAVSTTTPKVDCSKAGAEYRDVGPPGGRRWRKLSLRPGCLLVRGEGQFINCGKEACSMRSIPTERSSTRRPFVLKTTREEDHTPMKASLVDLQVDCSKAGPGYSKMHEDDIKRRTRFMPPGCNFVSGRGNFVSCVKMVCPCKGKECGDTCVPPKPGTGPFKCQTSTAGGKYSTCVPAASVKCPDAATTAPALTTRTPFVSTTRTPFVSTTRTAPEKDLTPSKVDCSKAGPGYSNMDSTARGRLDRFLPPGCSIISGRGNFVNCVKMVCPCKDKACGDACVPATESIGQFKCQARAKGFGCVPADSVKCPAQKVVVTTRSNLRAEKKLTPGFVITKPTGSSNTGAEVTTEIKAPVTIRTKGITSAIEATVGDGKTVFQAVADVVADPGCALEVTFVAVLLPLSSLFSQ